MSYSNGVVSVGTAAVKICTPGRDGAQVQNLGTAVVYLGGPGVTADAGAAGGITLGTAAAGTSVPVMIRSGAVAGTVGGDEGLYGRVAGGTSNVAFLAVV
jgi:hypothetical protein